MPLRQFRKRQKLIYWITAVLVIPAFVLVFGRSGSAIMQQMRRPNPNVATIDGETIGWLDLNSFQDPNGTGRLPAAVGGMGVRLRYPNQLMPMLLPELDFKDKDLISHMDARVSSVLALALLKQAEKVGLDASDREVGYYIHQQPYFFGIEDDEAFQKAYKERLKSLRINHEEYLRGVRDWLKIRKFVELLDQSLPMAPSDAYALYARKHTKCTYKRLVVRITQEMRDAAIDKVAGVTEKNKAPDPAVTNAAVERFLAEHPNDRRFWIKSKWRFEYVLAPFDALPVELDEKDYRSYFDQHKWQYKDKKYEEVHDEIVKKVKTERQRAMAKRTLETELTSFLRNRIKRKESVTLADIEAGLSKRGVKTGVSSTEAVPTDEFRRLELIGDSTDLASYLDEIDRMEDTKKRDDIIASQRDRHQFDIRSTLLSCKAGLLRVRILDYTPSRPRPLRDESGKIDGQLRLMVVDELQQEAAGEAAKKLAEQYGEKMRKGETEDLDTITEESKEYPQVRFELRDAALNDPQVFPLYGDGKVTGYEVLMLTARLRPSRASFDSLPKDERDRFIDEATWRWQGRMMPRSWYFNAAIISPGPVLRQWLIDAVKSGRIKMFYKRPKKEAKKADES